MLTSSYTVSAGRIPDLFSKIRDAQAPDQVTNTLLKDWGLTSSNDRALIPLLKALGFLSPDGKPTSRYHDYRNHSRSSAVMAEAIKEAYEDIFFIKEKPSEADRDAIVGKFKSFHNTSDNVAKLMANNFFQLLQLADLDASPSTENEVVIDKDTTPSAATGLAAPTSLKAASTGLHYNIQIHLPATKDIEVYNAIFKSVREHLNVVVKAG
ncbi:MAG: DUF5343 domain-containing protein [Pseudomonadota bacterium]